MSDSSPKDSSQDPSQAPGLPERVRKAPSVQKPMPRWRTELFPKFAAPVALLLRLYWRSVRLRVSGEEHIAPLLASQTRFIPCCWHQRQIFAICYLRRLTKLGVNPGALVSPSKDGELGARLLAKLGVAAVRGSGRRSGALAMRDMYIAIKEQNLSPLIAPDGSTGPPHEFKPGAIMLARLSGSPVVPLSFAATWAIKLRTWDRLLVPLPFSRVEVVIGEPIELEPIMAMTESQETIDRMGAALSEVETIAEELVA
ncbi:MAG: lysophospholipid acyltransferase family protein [Planctomycetota bacterium]